MNIYIYGDHLPSLRLNEEDGYLEDDYLKYGTPICAYSNYKTLETEYEYLSIFQLVPQILRDSGITYSAYFDAIAAILEEYPIVQSAWDIDLDDESIKRLYRIEYDLMFGEKYLLR